MVFPEAVRGYGVQTAQTFTVTNTGARRLTNLRAKLDGSRFEISSALSSAAIDPGETATVRVRPKTGLNVNTYNDTLTITGSEGYPAFYGDIDANFQSRY
jgi:hypothetical protein